MSWNLWLLYVSLAGALIVSPGPSALLCVSHGVSHGVRRTLGTVLGGITASMTLMLLSALGRCLAEGGDPFDTAAAIAAALPPAENTHGSAVRSQCGGVRQEALSGFPTARHMRERLESAGPLSALVWAMSRLDDSTLVYRGGPQGLAYVRRRAAELLRLPEEALPPALEALDDDLMARHLSRSEEHTSELQSQR